MLFFLVLQHKYMYIPARRLIYRKHDRNQRFWASDIPQEPDHRMEVQFLNDMNGIG